MASATSARTVIARGRKAKPEVLLDGAKNEGVVEIVLGETLADLGRKECRDLGVGAAPYDKDGVKAVAPFALVEPEDAGGGDRGLAAVALDDELGVLGIGGEVAEAPEIPAVAHRRRLRRDDRWLGGALADQAVGGEFAERLADGDQADAEATGDFGFLRQAGADREAAVGDRRAEDVGELAIERAVRPDELAGGQSVEAGGAVVHDGLIDACLLRQGGGMPPSLC